MIIQTPIVFCTFSRYDTTMKVFSAIKKAKPSKLYLISDAARSGNEDERREVGRIRASIEKEVDWDCEFVKIYADENMGCAKRITSALDQVFEEEDAAIILEDDCYPADCFFEYCQTLLDKYKEDDRVLSICGSTEVDYSPSTNIDYFFSKEFGSCGWATWKRAWTLFDYDMKDYPVKIRENKRLLKRTLFDKRAYWNYLAQWDTLYKNTKKFSWAFIFSYESIINDKYNIVPAVNLIRNLGFGDGATNTTKSIDYYVTDIKELSFPLRGPKTVYRETDYDKMIYKYRHGAGLVVKIKHILGLDVNKSVFGR